MATRRPGPAPKDPSERARRNADPVVGSDGWTDVQPTAKLRRVPPIPEWIYVGDVTRAFYLELTKLPQATTWSAGDWLMLHSTLPLLERYFTKPGSESFKAWTAVLDPGLRITTDAMMKARMRIRTPEKETAGGSTQRRGAGKVTDLAARRGRLTKGA
jgi:hypothetical protein